MANIWFINFCTQLKLDIRVYVYVEFIDSTGRKKNNKKLSAVRDMQTTTLAFVLNWELFLILFCIFHPKYFCIVVACRCRRCCESPSAAFKWVIITLRPVLLPFCLFFLFLFRSLFDKQTKIEIKTIKKEQHSESSNTVSLSHTHTLTHSYIHWQQN